MQLYAILPLKYIILTEKFPWIKSLLISASLNQGLTQKSPGTSQQCGIDRSSTKWDLN